MKKPIVNYGLWAYVEPCWDCGDHEHTWKPVLVVKVTPKFVIIPQDWPLGLRGLGSTETVRLDRAELEAKGSTYCRHRLRGGNYYTDQGKARLVAQLVAARFGQVSQELTALGLPLDQAPTASAVRAAFARRVREHHPDAGGTGDGAAMARLLAARDRLMRVTGQ